MAGISFYSWKFHYSGKASKTAKSIETFSYFCSKFGFNDLFEQIATIM